MNMYWKFTLILLLSFFAVHQSMAAWFYDYKTGFSDIVLEYGEDYVYVDDNWRQKKLLGKQKRFFDPSIYPFSSVGLLSNNIGVCTAFLIGPREILTAAHCVINEHKKVFYSNFHVSFENFGNRQYGVRYEATPVIGGWNLKQKKFLGKNDWYLLKVNEPIGRKIGWLGMKDSKGRTTKPSQNIDFRNFKLGKKTFFYNDGSSRTELIQEGSFDPKWIKTSSNILSNLRNMTNPWLLTDLLLYSDYEKTMTILPSFMFTTSIDIQNNGVDRIYYPMSISYDCHLRGFHKGLVVNDCSTSQAGSGGPFLEIKSNQVYNVAISSISRPKINLHKEYEKNYEITIDLLQVNDLIINNTHNSPEYKRLIDSLKQNDVTLQPPITSQYVSKIMKKYLENMKISQSTQSDFKFNINDNPRGQGRNDHYNLAVPTDTYFDIVVNYLKQEYPNDF